MKGRFSFRLRIILLSTLLSGLVLAGFGLWAWNLVKRTSVERLDMRILDLGEDNLNRRRPPEHWANLVQSPPFLRGMDLEDSFILLVKDRGGQVLFASENWPEELAPERFVNPEDLDFPPESAGPPRRMFRFQGRGDRGPPGPPPGVEGPPGRRLGRLLGPAFGGPPLPVRTQALFTQRAGGREWRIGVLSNPDVTFVLGLNMARVNREMRGLRDAFLLALPAALLLIAAGGWWVAQRALRPILALTYAAEGITAKGLDQRIPEEGGDGELARLVHVFNGMLDRLERSFRQATRFSADAAHELKTPLAVLQGELEQALQEAPAASPQQQTLSRLLEEVQRLKTIVRKLLLLSLADSGQLRPHLERVNLSEAVEEAREDMAILAPDLKVETNLEPNVWVLADGDLLRQVIQNLGSNAIKYNRPGGTVALRLRAENGRVRLTVANTGKGIPAEDRARVFERFYRADRARNRRIDGVGLGLNLARELARAHGGDLRLEDTPEGWTAFTLTLPAAGRDAG
jgi:two-component system heavy metal sensor histidine kinase CusS